MIIAVKTRELKRDLDYDWEDYFPSDKVLLCEAGKLHRALEGGDVDSRFVSLVRSPDSPSQILLGVSVSTSRNDAVGRPIRTMAFLRAENAAESNLLAAFFAECLRKKDEETLYDPEGGVAKAVESLYQTKKPDEFLVFCKSLKPVAGKGGAPENRWAIPRNDEGERKSLADALPAAIAGDSPFLFALTDRLPTDVLASLGSMFDRGTIQIFSKVTTAKEPIPGGPPNTRSVAAAIGGAAILAVILLVAAVRSCGTTGADQHGGRGAGTNAPPVGPRGPTNVVDFECFGTNAPASEAVCQTNAVSPRGTNEVIRAINSGNSGTNAPPSSAISPTNAVTSQGRSGESETPIQGMD